MVDMNRSVIDYGAPTRFRWRADLYRFLCISTHCILAVFGVYLLAVCHGGSQHITSPKLWLPLALNQFGGSSDIFWVGSGVELIGNFGAYRFDSAEAYAKGCDDHALY
jgi:hypothetical protein